jgi:hypothetical protein
MCSFRQATEAAILAYDSSFIDEDEFVLLYDMCHSKNPELPYQNYESFELDNIDEAECEVQFRFKKHDEVPVLARAKGCAWTIHMPTRNYLRRNGGSVHAVAAILLPV